MTSQMQALTYPRTRVMRLTLKRCAMRPTCRTVSYLAAIAALSGKVAQINDDICASSDICTHSMFVPNGGELAPIKEDVNFDRCTQK